MFLVIHLESDSMMMDGGCRPEFLHIDLWDDHMFSTIKLVSRHQNTQQFGALLPIELTNEEIRNSNAYKEYYVIAIGAAPPKLRVSVRKTRSSSDTSITPLSVAVSPRLTSSQKGKQATKASKAKSLSALSEMKELVLYQGFPMYPLMSLRKNSTDDEGDADEGKDGDDDEEDKGDDGEEGDGADDGEDDDGEEGNDDDDDQEVEQDDDKDDDEEGNGDKDLGLNISGEEGHIKEEEDDELYRDININQGRGLQMTQEVEDSHVTLTLVNPDGQQQSSSVSSQFVTSMLNPTLDVGIESIFETTSQLDVQTPTSVAPLTISASTMTSSTIATITTTSQAPILPTTVSSTIIQNLPNVGLLFRFDDRLRSLEVNFSKAMQTNQFAGVVSAIPGIVHQYMDQRMNKAVKVAIQIQSDRLRDEAQRDNDEFLKTVDENMQKIIKEQVKEQVKVQVSKILPRIEKAVNEQLEAEVLTRSSHSSRTSYDEEPSAGPDRGSKRCREGNEPESVRAPMETATRSAGRSTQGSRSRQASAREFAFSEEPMQTTSQMEEPSHPEFDIGAEDQLIIQSSQQPEWFSQQQKPPSPYRTCNKTVPAVYESIQLWIRDLAKQSDTRSYFNKLMDTPMDFSNFLINWLKVDTLTPELLAGPTYKLMKGSCKSLGELEYHLEEVFKATTDQLDWVNPKGQQYPHNLLKSLPLIPNYRGRRVFLFEHFINNDLDYLRGGASSHKYTTSITKTKAADYGHIKWIEDLAPRTMWIEEPICYDKHALWGVSY
nr:hypothetical protein [Tanacetum cinerariifolium]